MKPRGEFNCPYSLFRPDLKDTFVPEASSDPADMHGFNYPLKGLSHQIFKSFYHLRY
jgi:hypothetical protein